MDSLLVGSRGSGEAHLALRLSAIPRCNQSQSFSLDHAFACVQRWIIKLQDICEAKFPAIAHLESEFPVLAALDFLDMELPGQYQQMEYNPDSVVYVERLASDVATLRRHCISLRRIEFVCSDGRSRCFSVHTGQPLGSMGNTDQRMTMAFRCATCAAHAYMHHCNLQFVDVWHTYPQLCHMCCTHESTCCERLAACL